MPPPKPFSIAIIGGGISGLVLAIALHRRQIPVTIYEQAGRFGEIGAGVGFGPNAVQAMRICDKSIEEAFLTISTHNQWPSKKHVWFDFLDGRDVDSGETGHQDAVFQIPTTRGQHAGCHRAHFLDQMVKLVPEDIAKFGKRLKDISENQNSGKMIMKFHDGTAAEADAVIGCDGIKSRMRQILVGDGHLSANPVCTHKYAYRGLIPMKTAVEALGEERAQNACLHMGQDAHALTFPVNHGQMLNLVAFCTNKDDWPDHQRLTRSAKREDAIKDYAGFGGTVHALLNLTKPDLDCWAIFDLGDHPVPTYYKGRVCILGDAAHASSPHHGAGAGFAVEDCAFLSELLADGRVKSLRDLEAVFATFDAHRRPRTQWSVQSSRRCADLYEWRAEGVGRDLKKIEQEVNERTAVVWYVDVRKMVDEAKEELATRLSWI